MTVTVPVTRHRRVRPWLAGALLLLMAPMVRATTVLPLNLADLVKHSDAIVIGTVERVTDGFDERHVPYTEVTLKVSDRLRGPAGDTLRFRQFGLTAPRTIGGRTYLGVSPDGWPTWQERERVMVFLGRPGKQTGLRTTVGLGQGKMQLRDGTLANAAQNAGLFKDLRVTARDLSAEQRAMLKTERKPVDTAAFVSLVRRAVNENWIGTGAMRHAN